MREQNTKCKSAPSYTEAATVMRYGSVRRKHASAPSYTEAAIVMRNSSIRRENAFQQLFA